MINTTKRYGSLNRLPILTPRSIFHFTRRARGESTASNGLRMRYSDFNSRDARGASRGTVELFCGKNTFQLTRRARGESRFRNRSTNGVRISTHATRAGRVVNINRYQSAGGNFNSRDARGVSQNGLSASKGLCGFQLTRRARGESRVHHMVTSV